MKTQKSIFKRAFTLMEIGMGLLIVSILVMLCIPIVSNQIKKTDEFAYYAAFKTVEKLGSQIVAFGDPGLNFVTAEDDLGYTNFKRKNNLIVEFFDKIFKSINPKAFADSETTEIVSFPSYEYDYVRLCLGNPNVRKHTTDGSILYYSQAEIQYFQAQSLCTKYKTDDFIKKRFMCPSGASFETVKQVLSQNAMDLQSYCKFIAQNCTGAYDCSSDKKLCYFPLDNGLGYCIISLNDPDINDTTSISPLIDNSAAYSSISCSNYGLSGTSMGNSPHINTCNCVVSTPVRALNNSNFCCSSPQEGYYAYYIAANKVNNTPETSVNCQLGCFNEKTGTCCPLYSRYSKALGRCVCDDGYTPDSETNLTTCNTNINENNCPLGTHFVGSTCVTNAPIIKAKRFCELVSYYWNVSTHNCNTFVQSESGTEYYKTLYDAITQPDEDGDTPYLSTKAVIGAFNNITPNIVFSNGLRLWILEDKSASIPGLSFNPNDYTPGVNTCHENSGSESTTKYECSPGNQVFDINKGTGTLALDDARTCCSTSDFSSLINLYEGKDYLKDPRTYAVSGFTVFVDITGTKDNDTVGGGGTLWKDVFPFYIGANGQVYPAYPLNAAKANSAGQEKDSASLYQGGNSSMLSSDVYYFDIVDNKRSRVNAYSSIPYARALCFSSSVSVYTPYCQNLGTKFREVQNTSIQDFINSSANPCHEHRCFIKLKNKIKYL